ncbi:hypothetical protein [Paenirhodobacter populi]|uniref:Uncharacterized protein n=1 Tax=Paenirhodobacter populi TaxID=2306993 RepID=A0A443JMZ9_9RHOB|nr:hypothetical protein [Sinirhodobacter populi]RWR21895.1 hypothetical protein D2T30_07710 [Sinirhodobacter populi]
MHPKDLPRIQGRAFDIETLQHEALSLAKQARKGPTWIRQGGRIAYVVMTEEVFDEVWPDKQRALSLHDMPLRYEQMLLQGLEENAARLLAEKSDQNAPNLRIIETE